jgi:hypothetical protein
MPTNYLTETQMDSLIQQCRDLRKGHKLHPLRKAFTVIVDDQHVEIATTTRLRKFLSCVMFPQKYRVFRNMDKGVTINLEDKS